MIISFTPMRRDNALELHKSGDTLTINGEPFDLSGVPDGATLPQAAVQCDMLASDIERIDGQLHLTLILPHGPNAPQDTLFPQTRTLTADGPVALPTYDTPSQEDAQ